MYTYVYVYIYIYIYMRRRGVRVEVHTLCEELTKLAETRLAQNTLDCINIT